MLGTIIDCMTCLDQLVNDWIIGVETNLHFVIYIILLYIVSRQCVHSSSHSCHCYILTRPIVKISHKTTTPLGENHNRKKYLNNFECKVMTCVLLNH